LKYNFSYGEDSYSRPFIFIKAVNNKNENLVIVIFQRRSEFSGTYIAFDPSYKAISFFGSECLLTKELEEKLKNLFENGKYFDKIKLIGDF